MSRLSGSARLALAALLAALSFQAPLAAQVAGQTAGQAAPTPQELVDGAEYDEARGALAAAREAWLAAGAAFPAGAEQDAARRRARLVELRLALRTELIVAQPRDALVFAELGIGAVDALGLRVGGKQQLWNEVSIALLRRAGAAARVVGGARAGLVQEALARGTPVERGEALVELGKALEAREVEREDAFAAVAYARKEPVPAGGYVFQAGVWAAAEVAAANAQNPDFEEPARLLETAAPAARDEAFARLLALGEPARPRLARALELRFLHAQRALERGATFKDLAALAELRRELDLRRKAALDLIFDEEQYFHPHRPPECPPEKAKLYPGVQQRVDELVARVREAWVAPGRKVKLAKGFVEALGELEWNRARQKELQLGFALAKPQPAWIEGVDTRLETLELASFAWDAAERAGLAHDRAVALHNQRLFKHKAWSAVEAPNAEEQVELKLTNDYRVMLGRRALAWNPRLQVAAQGHSDAMAHTGRFSHQEDDPERRTMGQRLRLAGYERGVSENIAYVDGAESAHVGWLHSSGHHRNILEAGHTELGVGVAGSYWTQNFGVDTAFEKELGGRAGP